MIFAAVANSEGGLFVTFLIQTGNPVMTFVAFFMKVITGESIASMLYYSNNSLFSGALGRIIFSTPGWLTISLIVQSAIMFFFIWLSARRLQPGNK